MVTLPPKFTLTDDHVTLLRHANVSFSDRGGPQFDTTRPYGNSDVDQDIARILGWELFKDRHGETHLSAEQGKEAERLHGEMWVALQVVLSACSFEPGTYLRVQEFGSEYVRTGAPGPTA